VSADTGRPGDGGDDDGSTADAELERIRAEIERMDREMIALIARRVRLAREIGKQKQALGLPVLDPAREAGIVRRAGELAREAGLDDEDVRYIFWHLIGLSRRAQMVGS
jgi:chorismate mutase